MKSSSHRKGLRTTSKGSRSKIAKRVPPYHEVDIHAKIAELASRSEKAREAYERSNTTFTLVLALIDLRESAGLSQKQLAERMGVSQQMVSKMENVNYEGRTFAKLWRHLDALGYRPEIKAVPIEKWRKKHPIPGLKE